MATQSLYRRYRPRRFSELKGQDHVVRALRDAVASGREGQAYLFSGPRGTGKTSSARILAKVLNCERPVDGEPCCECESCLAVERGVSYDVHELDAASNNGVEAIRDLVEKSALGTPGRHKVYILDEVHMLSRSAEAALLKTLEEPPPHVVFVLATTDPQKMSETIRSRTQHLQFHLLPADTLEAHVRWVAADAGLELTDAAIDAVLTQGGGSARDTLSALELMASTGGDVSDVIDLDEFVQAMIDHDPGRVLTAMAFAVGLGRDPRTLTEELVRHLRNGFLSLMAPELVQLPQHRVDQVAAQSQQLGAAALVRAIETLGSALVEMRHAPDPRILVEVALVQLTHDDAAGDLGALTSRLERLEQAMKAGGGAAPAGQPPASAPVDPGTGRAVLGGRAQQRPAAAPAPAAATRSPVEPVAADVPVGDGEAAGAAGASTPAVVASGTTVPDAWEATVKAGLKPFVRALYSAGSFTGNDGATWHFSVPNAAHGKKCAEHRADVEAALSAAVGSPITIVIGEGVNDDPDHSGPMPRTASPTVAAPTTSGGASGQARSTGADVARAPESATNDDEPFDPDELTDAPPETVLTPIDRLAQAFPGSELVADERD
ncbi:MAG TPA: DNA polymerase III subunit gamma/tau [Ilumatobacteraceae bacterium]|nr:DNA polymerase III subunit gamma/tau [Ilumatobacteraceae bacterium]